MISLNDIHWAAGFIEGEGSFLKPPGKLRIDVHQVQKWPLEKMYNLFGGTMNLHKRPLNSRQSPIWGWSLRGIKARALSMTIYPLMSPKRQYQILSALKFWRQRPPATHLRKHCPRGHAYSPTNTIVSKEGYRRCLKCRMAWDEKNRPSKSKRKIRNSKNQFAFKFLT